MPCYTGVGPRNFKSCPWSLLVVLPGLMSSPLFVRIPALLWPVLGEPVWIHAELLAVRGALPSERGARRGRVVPGTAPHRPQDGDP